MRTVTIEADKRPRIVANQLGGHAALSNQSGVQAWSIPFLIGEESRQSADAAFAELVDLHYRRTYALIYRMVRSEQDAADLTQEAFVRVYKALGRLREEGAAGAWIRRIATNLCLDFLRKRNSLPAFSS